MNPPTPQESRLLVISRNPNLFWEPKPELTAQIHARWPELRIAHSSSAAELQSELIETNILVTRLLSPEEFASARNLKWIHSLATGVTPMMHPELRQSGIEMTNASTVHSVPMAEHIVGMLLALARRFPDCFRSQQQSRWAQQEFSDAPVKPRELRGQVLLFIGFGAIGRAVATLLRPFDMRIWTVTRSGRVDPELAEKSFPAARIQEALPAADFIVVAVPDTDETREMIGVPEFALMKRNAYFVNVGRGSVANEPALIAALEARTIAGAGLDVTGREPLPPESPLWKLDNVFITPHVSPLSERVWERQSQLLEENLERWFDGRELLNRVSLTKGY